MNSVHVAVAIACLALQVQSMPAPEFEKLPFAPRQATCYRTSTPIQIDGKLAEAAWHAVQWSEPFVDIDGIRRPRVATRVKMLWDDDFFYIAADLDEPHLWATLKARDSVIFQDNDFEVFIDPDGDTHLYFEIEINALNTVWDLLLVKPYRDGGPALHAWDIAGLKTAVDLRGTLNRPDDRDDGWSIEIALPWRILREGARRSVPPRAGDRWRVNFSRVQWQLDQTKGSYAKRLDPRTGTPLPEDNWVWSPQGAVDMHMPERWGIVQFSNAAPGTAAVTFVEDRNERVKWALRRLYYRQRDFRTANGRYASDLAMIDASNIAVDGLDFKPSVQVTDSLYEMRANGFDGAVVRLRQDGRVWVD
ncbi:MAG TPA: carbohydrate-binding family 9-like protein [Vicinamibacterales bacterium]|nr:carbohydrate-binding family 9-like protein [Vicinamibacterales bacterium]